jgi:hypothetical protein
VQLLSALPFDKLFDAAFLRYTTSSELISVDSVHGGVLNELTYSIGLKSPSQIQDLLAEIKNLNGNNKVTLIAGYNTTDL